jgi:hypothetical protein
MNPEDARESRELTRIGFLITHPDSFARIREIRGQIMISE